MAAMKCGRKKRVAMNAEPQRQVVGPRYLRLIEEHLDVLHNQPAHGNRGFFLDQLVIAHLLAFFNPSVQGLRSIEDLFEDPKRRKKFGLVRAPKSTIADAQRLFDPDLLLPLIDSLVQRAQIQPHDRRLDVLTRKLLAVDGSFFAVAPRILWALYNQSEATGIRKGQVRLHINFDVLKGIPEAAAITSGQVREAKVLQSKLQEDCIYVLDRGFQAYQLIRDILAAKSDVVVRVRKPTTNKIIAINPLTEEDIKEDVISDHHIELKNSRKKHDLPTLRLIIVAYTDRDDQPREMLLLTTLMDIPAWVIAMIYQHRWQVELFFRWLKTSAHFNHFFSESESGMTLQVNVMMIALLLIAIDTGARPSRYDYAIMSEVYFGEMDFDVAMKIATRRRKERQRAAELARKKRNK